MNDFRPTKAYVYFNNRRYLSAESNGAGQWNWRYVNGNGNPIAEGTVSALTIIDALLAAAEDADLEGNLDA